MALEAYPTSHAAFLATDKNDDGKIDPEEWAGLAKKLVGSWKALVKGAGS